jgi:hypothetical protein
VWVAGDTLLTTGSYSQVRLVWTALKALPVRMLVEGVLLDEFKMGNQIKIVVKGCFSSSDFGRDVCL